MKLFPVRLKTAAASTILALGLAAAGACQAATTSFLFTGNGFAIASPCSGNSDCGEVITVGDADDLAGFTSPIPGSWASFLTFSVTISTGLASGTWEFSDIEASANDLHGTLTGRFEQVSSTLYKGSIDYLVTGGHGLFAGATGSGHSSLYFDPDYNFVESGGFSVSAVPEAPTSLMLMAGLAAAGLVLRRRGVV